MLRSGVWRPAIAVTILSWATVHGIAVTVTLMFGLAFSKDWITSLAGSLSPSSPIAHIDRVTGPEVVPDEPEPPPQAAGRAMASSASSRWAGRMDLIWGNPLSVGAGRC